MVIVDSSVWIDHFNGVSTPETSKLKSLLSVKTLASGDMIVTEILRLIRSDDLFNRTKNLLLSFTVYEMVGVQRAIQAASYYRKLRTKGITIRKTADVIIASFCINEGHTLLFSDKDFLPFVEHFGLKTLETPTGFKWCVVILPRRAFLWDNPAAVIMVGYDVAHCHASTDHVLEDLMALKVR